MHLYIYLQQYTIGQIYIQSYVACLSENSLGISHLYSDKGNLAKIIRRCIYMRYTSYLLKQWIIFVLIYILWYILDSLV